MNDMAGSINARCADRLREAADLLEAQGANPFRVSAYRKAATTVLELPEDLAARVDRDGLPGLEALPNIGRGIAAALLEMVRTGRWTQLERLRGSADPVQLLTAVPGLGHRLAERIHDELQVDTLEGLELVAHDGRLESVPGVGPRRAAAIRASLQTMLSRSRPHHAPRTQGAADGPGVAILLAVDDEYRRKAEAGSLPTIAPRRFNPEGESWLPVLHAERDGWHFTALVFKHRAGAPTRPHARLGRALLLRRRARRGAAHRRHRNARPARGRRVVRGREAECRAHYSS